MAGGLSATVLAPYGRGPPPPPLRSAPPGGGPRVPSAAAAWMRPESEAAPASPWAGEGGRGTANGEESPLQPLVTRAARPAASPRRQLGCCGRRRGKEPRWGRCWSGQPGRAGPGEHFRRRDGGDGEPFLGGRSQPAPWPRAPRTEGARAGLAVGRGGGQSARVGELSFPAAAFPARLPSAPPLPPDDAAPSLRVPRAALDPPKPPLALAAFGTGRNSLWRCGK